MALKDIEYWDPECVDNFEKYNTHLTQDETEKLINIRKKIFDLKTPEDEIPLLYREAVDILHKAYCRERPHRKCTLREATEEELLEGVGFYGVSESIINRFHFYSTLLIIT